ncbi:redox-regulated ATPase YchF [Candidatus Woesearchaeota archaeon]|nr:redox-regulated ATPase YchF [Candidatus Woesearchaeota archaeon]MBW2978864.1 redox-regulated ATPase YchF [Candidatus Woesearchaeota archaeon]
MIIGVVGKANVGKSTFFKALTLAEVLIANYPFATIDPNKGFGHVRVECAEKYFNVKCNPRLGYCMDGIRFVPVEVIDVAGLVPGAHEGKGMGNKFLDDLRQADALIHVVDIAGSTNEKGEPVDPGKYDPSFDIKFLEMEIDMWYLSILKKGWEKLARHMQQEKKQITKIISKQLSGLNVTEEMTEEILKKLELNLEKPVEWTEEQLLKLAKEFRKKTKPMIIAANKIDLPGADKNYEKIKKEFSDYIIIPCSAESELALKEAAKKQLIKYIPGNENFEIIGNLTEKQEKALNFIKEKILTKWKSTGVQQTIDDSVFKLLKRIAVFPGGINKLADQHGNILPDCFLLPEGAKAIDFAYTVHSDFGDNFIRAIDVKTKRTIGKDHALKHLDVIEIISKK